jgi:hypothetical protein
MSRSKKRAEPVAPAPAPVPEKKQGKCGPSLHHLFLLTIIGTVLALAVSEPLRSKVLDILFGAEEEFQYTPPSPAGA